MKKKPVIASELSLLSAAQKSLEQAPIEAFQLVSWRLERQSLCSVELLLLCKMLAGAAKQLTSAEQALNCISLVIGIRNRAPKVTIVFLPKF